MSSIDDEWQAYLDRQVTYYDGAGNRIVSSPLAMGIANSNIRTDNRLADLVDRYGMPDRTLDNLLSEVELRLDVPLSTPVTTPSSLMSDEVNAIRRLEASLPAMPTRARLMEEMSPLAPPTPVTQTQEHPYNISLHSIYSNMYDRIQSKKEDGKAMNSQLSKEDVPIIVKIFISDIFSEVFLSAIEEYDGSEAVTLIEVDKDVSYTVKMSLNTCKKLLKDLKLDIDETYVTGSVIAAASVDCEFTTRAYSKLESLFYSALVRYSRAYIHDYDGTAKLIGRGNL